MRILLCDRLLPDGPASGPAIAAVEKHLLAMGHQAEHVLLPYHDVFAAAAGQLMAFRLLQMSDWCDHLIAFGAPTHVLDHPSKAIWCWNEPVSLLPKAGETLPGWISTSDSFGFGTAAALFASTAARQLDLQGRGLTVGLLPAGTDDASWAAATVALLPALAGGDEA